MDKFLLRERHKVVILFSFIDQIYVFLVIPVGEFKYHLTGAGGGGGRY